MADFISELRKQYKLEKELADLESTRNVTHAAACQAIAAKQAEVTKAKRAAQAAA